MHLFWVFLFFLTTLTACTPVFVPEEPLAPDLIEAEISFSREPISYVNTISPYPNDFDFEGEHSYEEILTAFEEAFPQKSGFAEGGTDASLLFEAFGAFVSKEQLGKLDQWILIGNHSEEDELGRTTFSFKENLWGDFGEELFRVEHYDYEGETTYIEFWLAMKQADQLAFPRVVYVYYSGPLDRIDELPHY